MGNGLETEVKAIGTYRFILSTNYDLYLVFVFAIKINPVYVSKLDE